MLWFISLSTKEEFLHFTIEIELINLKGNSVELKCSKWWCIQMAIFTGIIERPKMRKLVWQLIRYSRRWFHGRVAVCRLFAFHWPTLTCRREKKMFELQPNVFRNFKWLPTLIYTLTRLIYSREIFEMFKTFLVFFFHETGRAHVSQRVQQFGSCDVPMEFLSRDDKWWMSEASHN